LVVLQIGKAKDLSAPLRILHSRDVPIQGPNCLWLAHGLCCTGLKEAARVALGALSVQTWTGQ
jgi:hypothetical protein